MRDRSPDKPDLSAPCCLASSCECESESREPVSLLQSRVDFPGCSIDSRLGSPSLRAAMPPLLSSIELNAVYCATWAADSPEREHFDRCLGLHEALLMAIVRYDALEASGSRGSGEPSARFFTAPRLETPADAMTDATPEGATPPPLPPTPPTPDAPEAAPCAAPPSASRLSRALACWDAPSARTLAAALAAEGHEANRRGEAATAARLFDEAYAKSYAQAHATAAEEGVGVAVAKELASHLLSAANMHLKAGDWAEARTRYMQLLRHGPTLDGRFTMEAAIKLKCEEKLRALDELQAQTRTPVGSCGVAATVGDGVEEAAAALLRSANAEAAALLQSAEAERARLLAAAEATVAALLAAADEELEVRLKLAETSEVQRRKRAAELAAGHNNVARSILLEELRVLDDEATEQREHAEAEAAEAAARAARAVAEARAAEAEAALTVQLVQQVKAQAQAEVEEAKATLAAQAQAVAEAQRSEAALAKRMAEAEETVRTARAEAAAVLAAAEQKAAALLADMQAQAGRLRRASIGQAKHYAEALRQRPGATV